MNEINGMTDRSGPVMTHAANGLLRCVADGGACSPAQANRRCGSRGGRSRRRGFLLVELMVGLILLGIVATILPVTLRAVYQHRQQERFERLAQLELANQVAALQADSPETVDGRRYRLSVWFQDLYPSAGLTVSMENHLHEEDALIPVRITILHRADAEQRPLRQSLTTWLMRPEVQP